MTLQGVVFGCGTVGSAVAVLPEPIWSWAAAKAESKMSDETSVGANFKRWEVVTGSSERLVLEVARLDVVRAAKSRSGKGV